MKWYRTKYTTKCTNCLESIAVGDPNFASSTAVFCETCGLLKEKGELIWSKKQQTYIMVSDSIDDI